MIPHPRRIAILFGLSTLLLAAAPCTVMSQVLTDPLDPLASVVEIPGDLGDVDADPVDSTDTMTAPPPADFIESAGTLSQAEYPHTIREIFRVPMADGERLYVEVVRPDPDAHGNGPWPVIMEASPYHGTLADRSGTRIFPDPVDQFGTQIGLTGYFAPRGYAVAIVDLRGTGRSTGCLDHIGPNDASDLETVIEWAATRPWSSGRVGLTGHSYVGSTPSAAAARAPFGLATIAPSAGLASMYDHQFQKGVPYLLQWVGPMVAYEQLAIERDLPGGDNSDAFPNPQTGCGLPNSSLTAGSGQVTGQYEDWHAQRDWRDGAVLADIPVFMIHGVNDNAARIPGAEWFFGRRFGNRDDKVWLGQWDHGSTNGRCGDENGGRTLHPNCRFDQWKYALHAWFDKHLKGSNVQTGPAVEVFLNGEAPIDVTQVMDPEQVGGKVFTAKDWSEPTETFSLYPDAGDGSLRFEPPAQHASASFSVTANAVLAHVGAGRVVFESAPVSQNMLLLGLPGMQLNASVTSSEVVHLVATLFRVDAEGRQEPMNFCAIQPQLRNGVETLTPVVPLTEMALPLQCFTIAHWVPEGQRLRLEVSTQSPHHATFGSDLEITVYTGPGKSAYVLPRTTKVKLRDDVPLREPKPGFPPGPAQPGAQGSVLVPVSGAGTMVEPLTAASFEFDVLDGFDNARLEALAAPNLPADVDLYLQRQVNGGWGGSLAAAESGSLEQELLIAGRQAPGRYRIVVHNWAGAPADVRLTLTFFNQEGEAGGAGGTGFAGEPVPMFSNATTLLPQP